MGQELTIEQVKEALQKPELKTAVLAELETDVLTGIKAKGMIVRTKDEDTQFLANYETNIIPEKVKAVIGDKVREVHEMYDKDILEVTGLKKDPTEKTYEFNKRVLKTLAEKAAKAATGGDQVLKDQIADLTSKLKGYEGYVSPDEVGKLKEGYFKEKILSAVTGSLDKKPIAVPAHITDEKQKQAYVDVQRNMMKQDFISRFTAKQNSDGKTVYYEGETLLTNAADASPMNEQQIIEKYYSGYFVPEKKSAGGAGSGAGTGAGSDPGEANLKSKADIDKYLQEIKKLIPGGIDFNKERKRIMTEQGITD
ncbi:MAG: hypothetical protein JNK14_05795 [Chitinophagaceae bacterium]|nr:hypothetical protein [Chitinophagaceae bacterium]